MLGSARQLKKPGSSLAVESEEIQEVATNFYKDLLTMDEPSADRDACRQQIWGHV